ncbi:hypothetical protein V2J09_003351 [Rumex salicifolius]
MQLETLNEQLFGSILQVRYWLRCLKKAQKETEYIFPVIVMFILRVFFDPWAGKVDSCPMRQRRWIVDGGRLSG